VDPGEDLFIAATQKHMISKQCIRNAEETTASAIQGVELHVAKEWDVVVGQLSFSMKTDLVQHATEVDEAADFGIATAETWNVWHGDNAGVW
jgi:Zn finger protein HypA/HybF involved in hydrogenase expression